MVQRSRGARGSFGERSNVLVNRMYARSIRIHRNTPELDSNFTSPGKCPPPDPGAVTGLCALPRIWSPGRMGSIIFRYKVIKTLTLCWRASK